MKIIGKFRNKLVIKCDAGHYYEWGELLSNGSFFCDHENSTTYFDFVEIDKLVEITNNKIINEIIRKKVKEFKINF